MSTDAFTTLSADGMSLGAAAAASTPLVRAVMISLFTWRRANADDALPGTERMGWWGDNFAPQPPDPIGSRLWLLQRAKLTPDTVARAREYAEEALRWLVQDGVAARVEVEAERQGQNTLALAARIYKSDGSAPVDVRFANAWEFLNV